MPAWDFSHGILAIEGTATAFDLKAVRLPAQPQP